MNSINHLNRATLSVGSMAISGRLQGAATRFLIIVRNLIVLALLTLRSGC